jgi:prophage regulatory protein
MSDPECGAAPQADEIRGMMARGDAPGERTDDEGSRRQRKAADGLGDIRDVQLLKASSVLKRTALAKSSMYAMIRDGDFPSPVQIGPRAVAWVDEEVDAWIAERIRVRDRMQLAASTRHAGSNRSPKRDR